MNKDIKIARLEQKLSKAKSEIKKLKKETSQKASESKSKPSKKKESRTVYLTEEQRPSLLTLLKDIVIQGT